MLNIIFKKQNGPEKNLYLIAPETQGLVVSALSVRGYIVSVGADMNPWESDADYQTMDVVIDKHTGSPMLFADPRVHEYSDESAASLVLDAIEFYSPKRVYPTYKTIQRPVHYSSKEW